MYLGRTVYRKPHPGLEDVVSTLRGHPAGEAIVYTSSGLLAVELDLLRVHLLVHRVLLSNNREARESTSSQQHTITG